MGDKLTQQEIGFVKDLIKTGNATQAVKNNFDTITTDGSAREKGSTLLTRPNIQNAIAEALPDDLLSRKHLQFLNSEREEIGIKALDMGYKVKGFYAPEKSINLNLNGDIIPTEELEELAQQLNDIARNNTRQSFPGDGTPAGTVDQQA